MKTIFAIAALLAAGLATAAEMLPHQVPGSASQGLSAVGGTLTIEAAGRKGSKRVGGRSSSGKGGHYVGGRRR